MDEKLKNKILVEVVDDEQSYQYALTQKLKLEGFEVVGARDGKEGLALALLKHPDLILLDLNMPKMNGLEMAKILREDEWGKNAKIVILTNVSEMDNIQKAIESEIFIYLIKTDIKIEELVDKIKVITKQ